VFFLDTYKIQRRYEDDKFIYRKTIKNGIGAKIMISMWCCEIHKLIKDCFCSSFTVYFFNQTIVLNQFCCKKKKFFMSIRLWMTFSFFLLLSTCCREWICKNIYANLHPYKKDVEWVREKKKACFWRELWAVGIAIARILNGIFFK
jgi:hypothetical protein